MLEQELKVHKMMMEVERKEAIVREQARVLTVQMEKLREEEDEKRNAPITPAVGTAPMTPAVGTAPMTPAVGTAPMTTAVGTAQMRTSSVRKKTVHHNKC